MPEFSLAEVQQALGLPAEGGKVSFRGVETDTRKLTGGTLFVAFKGERFDGENFLAEAAARGATGAVVSDSCPGEKLKGAPQVVIRVPDTVKAYQQLAAFHRRRFELPVIAITGSNGKTTTKDLTAAVLSARLKVLKTAANFNNEIGLPLTLLQLTPEHEAAVVEIGMRGLGQIAALAPLAAPTIGIVTNVGETHIELLGSLENIAQAKAELVEAIKPGGTVILNADNRYVAEMKEKVRPGVRVVTFGIEKAADVQAVNIRQTGGGTLFDCCIGGRLVELHLPMAGRHNVSNALAAIAAGTVLGLDGREIQQGLDSLEVTGMRFECSRRGKWEIVNDAYNASPMSMEAAITTLAEVASGRRVLVLGDMLELGSFAAEAHRKVGRLAAESGAAMLVTCGKMSENIALGAEAAGMKEVFRAADHAAAAAILKERLRDGDTVLFKGSRGMRMEKIIDLL